MKNVFFTLTLVGASALSYADIETSESTPLVGIGMYGECANGSSIAFTSYGTSYADAWNYGNEVIEAYCSSNGGVVNK